MLTGVKFSCKGANARCELLGRDVVGGVKEGVDLGFAVAVAGKVFAQLFGHSRLFFFSTVCFSRCGLVVMERVKSSVLYQKVFSRKTTPHDPKNQNSTWALLSLFLSSRVHCARMAQYSILQACCAFVYSSRHHRHAPALWRMRLFESIVNAIVMMPRANIMGVIIRGFRQQNAAIRDGNSIVVIHGRWERVRLRIG